MKLRALNLRLMKYEVCRIFSFKLKCDKLQKHLLNWITQIPVIYECWKIFKLGIKKGAVLVAGKT